MLNAITEKINGLNDELKRIENEPPDILRKAEKSIICINKHLKQIKEIVNKNNFQSQVDEIQFFKEVKPSIYSKLIFYVKVFNIESKRPNGSVKSQKKHLQNELHKLETFFTDNLEFYQYVRNNMTYLDDKYFISGNFDIRLYLGTFTYDADPEFSTSHDFKVAKILANDLLCIYLNSEIAALDRKEQNNNKAPLLTKGKYTWSASKNAMVELIYALHATNAINDGKIDIKELAIFFENTFNIELGDIYRTFLEIKGRNQPAKFIDSLKNALSERIKDQMD